MMGIETNKLTVQIPEGTSWLDLVVEHRGSTLSFTPEASNELADEILELRAELAEMTKARDLSWKLHVKSADEANELRAELAEAYERMVAAGLVYVENGKYYDV